MNRLFNGYATAYHAPGFVTAMIDVSPRVLLVSQRKLRPSVCRTSQNEYEDVIASIDSVHLVAPERVPSSVGERGTLNERVASRLGLRVEAIPKPIHVELRDKYDLLFIVVQHPSDLNILDALPDWRERCRKAIVYVEEIWMKDLVYDKLLSSLRPFDVVVNNCYQSNAGLKERYGINAVYGAIATDSIRFCPVPLNPPRVIDFLSIGRRSAKTHAALLALSRKRNFFYVYDTMSPLTVMNHSEHRELYASRARRARYFLANRPKADRPDDTAGHQEVGMRYYEAIAAGVVMVGDAPVNAPMWAEHFGYEDACIRLPWDSTDVESLIDELDAQPQRIARIRHANVQASLSHHDWAHRWRQILQLADLPELPATAARFEHLARLASEANRVLAHSA